MFILRRLTSQNVEVNISLGDKYTLIYSDRNPEEFTYNLALLKCDPDDVYGFIVYNDGSVVMPLYSKSAYFVMVGNGQTFANISFK